jgi:hypothetical protein
MPKTIKLVITMTYMILIHEDKLISMYVMNEQFGLLTFKKMRNLMEMAIHQPNLIFKT